MLIVVRPRDDARQARRPARVRSLRRPRSWLRRVRAIRGRPARRARARRVVARRPTTTRPARRPSSRGRRGGASTTSRARGERRRVRCRHRLRPVRPYARCRRSSCRTGSRPAAPSESRAGVKRDRRRGDRAHRCVPPPRSDRRAGTGASRTSSCPNPVSPTTATCAPAAMSTLTSCSTGASPR